MRAFARRTHGTPARADRLMPGLCFALCLLVVVAAVAVPKGSRVVVIAPPGTPPDRMLSIITSSGGSLLAASARSWIAFAENPEPDFTARLFANGAVLVLDGAAAFLCSSEEPAP